MAATAVSYTHLERSQQFLLLSALLTLLLAVAAVAVAMNHYCRSRYDEALPLAGNCRAGGGYPGDGLGDDRR